jgi:hypothetical protein
MGSERICVAHGSISFVRARRIPMVSSVAAAISVFGLDSADHHLDCAYYPHLRDVALPHTWATVGRTPWLDNAAGIRMRSHCRGNNRFAADHPAASCTDTQWLNLSHNRFREGTASAVPHRNV